MQQLHSIMSPSWASLSSLQFSKRCFFISRVTKMPYRGCHSCTGEDEWNGRIRALAGLGTGRGKGWWQEDGVWEGVLIQRLRQQVESHDMLLDELSTCPAQLAASGLCINNARKTAQKIQPIRHAQCPIQCFTGYINNEAEPF